MFSGNDSLKYFQEESWIQRANPFITLKKKLSTLQVLVYAQPCHQQSTPRQPLIYFLWHSCSFWAIPINRIIFSFNVLLRFLHIVTCIHICTLFMGG